MTLEDKIETIEIKTGDDCRGENRSYDIDKGRNLCQLRKGNPRFKCTYLESNPVEIKHYCNYIR